MTSDRERRRRGREAAERYVDIDANSADHERDAALVEWLERSPNHEAAFERCEAAVTLARELAARGELDGLRAARVGWHVGFGARSARGISWLGRPAVAWSIAAVATVWAIAASVDRGVPVRSSDGAARTAAIAGGASDRTQGRDRRDPVEAPPPADATTAPAEGSPFSDSAANARVAGNAGGDDSAFARAGDASGVDPRLPSRSLVAWNPVAVLPGEIVVDVHSVAVLPFDNARTLAGSAPTREDAQQVAAAARIARQLHEEVMRQLSRIPGLYVVDGRSSAVYADGELEPDQIAALLSVRGVVAADVELDGRTVRVSLRMTDAATAGRPTEVILERPLDELPAVRTAIVANITDALDSTSF